LRNFTGQPPLVYVSIGCWKDTQKRSIPTLEAKDQYLDGIYQQRIHSIEKCARAAMRRGYSVFAVQVISFEICCGDRKSIDKSLSTKYFFPNCEITYRNFIVLLMFAIGHQ